jgi:hypothetical protein
MHHEIRIQMKGKIAIARRPRRSIVVEDLPCIGGIARRPPAGDAYQHTTAKKPMPAASGGTGCIHQVGGRKQSREKSICGKCWSAVISLISNQRVASGRVLTVARENFDARIGEAKPKHTSDTGPGESLKRESGEMSRLIFQSKGRVTKPNLGQVRAKFRPIRNVTVKDLIETIKQGNAVLRLVGVAVDC